MERVESPGTGGGSSPTAFPCHRLASRWQGTPTDAAFALCQSSSEALLGRFGSRPLLTAAVAFVTAGAFPGGC
ncbi:hypothetical protein [Streptomyces sp. NPDC058092]|uniref:hypothetical protein n=1 Tax=Streptomyces sp. NPDC058092 TaxID=3346336 RepID=UPI0036F03646